MRLKTGGSNLILFKSEKWQEVNDYSFKDIGMPLYASAVKVGTMAENCPNQMTIPTHPSISVSSGVELTQR